MSSWIIPIDAQNPEHWGIAVRDGVWDTTKRNKIQRGDVSYFWQVGNPSHIAGSAIAQSSVEALEGAPLPWNIEDAKRGDYKWRIQLQHLQTGSSRDLDWKQIQENTGTAVPQTVRQVPSSGEMWLYEAVHGLSPVDIVPSSVDATITYDPDKIAEEDERVRRFGLSVVRPGQGTFKNALLSAYEGRCAVTGCPLGALLDAAHISPHRGAQSDVAHNGLLLRKDLHALFDAGLMTFVYETPASLRTCVHPSAGEPYVELDGKFIDLPKDAKRWPSRMELENHHRSLSPWVLKQDLGGS